MADYCTVISIVPFPIDEPKPGLYPGHFRIPAAKAGDIEILAVGRSVHHVYLDNDRGSITVPTPSSEVARSICDDYSASQLAYFRGEAEPGVFFIDGEYKDKKSVLAVAKGEIERARMLQKNWFMRLVAIADDEWNKYHSHKTISELQRFAAKSLGLEREWNIEGTVNSLAFCPACKVPVKSDAIVCSSCRTIINVEAYKKAGFQQVGA